MANTVWLGITLIVSTFCLIFMLIGFKIPTWALIKFWGVSGFALMGKKVRIEGLENMVGKTPYIMVSNHGSLFDIPAQALLQRKLGVWVAKSSLFKIPIFGHALGRGIAIPVDRSSLKGAQKALRKAVENTKGHSILIFPEGTRSSDGKIQRFKRGFMKIARESGLDILPVTLKGFFEFYPKKRFWIHPWEELIIKISPAVKNDFLCAMNDKQASEYVQNIITGEYTSS